MKEQLKAFLGLEGYTTVVSNLPEFLVFLKKEYRHVSVIFVMELENDSSFTKERYESVYNSACKLLEKNGITEMHILTIVISGNIPHALEVCDGDKYAWVIDRSARQLIIEENKVVDFYGMKASLEMFLRDPDAAKRQIRETEEIVLNELKEQEKKLLKLIFIPWVAYALVALNIVIYIICTSTGELLYNIGEMSVATVFGEGQWYRLFTAMFLHGDFSHIFYNMLCLYLLGNVVEKRLGRWKFLACYFICGIVAGLISLCSMYSKGIEASGLGASGAVYGIFGIALVMELTTINWRRINYYTLFRLLLVMLCIVVSLYTDARTVGIDYEAHVSGLCMGAMIGMLWFFNLLRKKREKKNED